MIRTLIIAGLFGGILVTTLLVNSSDCKIMLHDCIIITGSDYMKLTLTNELLNTLGWSNLKERRNKQKALVMFKTLNEMIPILLFKGHFLMKYCDLNLY